MQTLKIKEDQINSLRIKFDKEKALLNQKVTFMETENKELRG